MIGKELKDLGKMVKTDEIMIAVKELKKGDTVPQHSHEDVAKEVFFITVIGDLEVTLNGEEKHGLTPGNLLNFPADTKVSVIANEDSKAFVFFVKK